jgi:quercetin dioxygenase-like cupin family protein
MRNTEFTMVEKGWGFEKWIVNKAQYCGKLLWFKKGKKCSVHYHILKDETFYLDRGAVEMHWMDMPDEEDVNYTQEQLLELFQKNKKVEVLTDGDSFYVPQGRIHQVVALEDSNVFEFSTEHFDSDSYRLQKGD